MKSMRLVFLIILIVIFALLAMVLSRGVINKETRYARKLAFENDKEVLAIFFLGGLEETYDYSVVEKYYSKEETESFETISLDGEECYLIVPRYNMNLTVSSLSMTEDGGTASKKVKDITKPFFLKCNISDIFSNAEISFEYDGVKYKYSPYISLKDGSVVTDEFVKLIEE